MSFINLVSLMDKIKHRSHWEFNPLNNFDSKDKDLSEDILQAENILGIMRKISNDVSVYQMCFDPHGSMILQHKLSDETDDIKKREIVCKIYDAVIYDVVSVMIDPFGNYLCQKLLDYIDKNQRINMFEKCKQQLSLISCNLHGSRVIQKWLSLLLESPSELIDHEHNIIKESFSCNIVNMINDINGNYVIKKCIQLANKNQFIYDVISERCVDVTNGKYSCCIFQYCLEIATPEQLSKIIDVVELNILHIIQDPYGNYVLQYIIECSHALKELKEYANFPTKVAKRITGNVYILSKNKCSSNVIEKTLKYGDEVCVKRIMNELLFNPVSSREKNIQQRLYSATYIQKAAFIEIVDLLKNDYGNYVIQTCLNESKIKASGLYLLMIQLLSPIKHNFECKRIKQHL